MDEFVIPPPFRIKLPVIAKVTVFVPLLLELYFSEPPFILTLPDTECFRTSSFEILLVYFGSLQHKYVIDLIVLSYFFEGLLNLSDD